MQTIIKDDFKSSVCKLEESKDNYLDTREVYKLYPKGTDFHRDPLQSKVWYYTCGVCSKDEYVSRGLCNGRFKIDITHLAAGRKSCRCSTRYKWTLPQRENQIKGICKERNHNFIRWVDKTKTTSHCRFEWSCEFGHICEMSVDNYRRGKGCKHCAVSTGNGYFPSRRDEDDYLYVMKINEDNTNPKNYFKVGRSFNPERRSKELKGEVNRKDERNMDFYPVIYLKGSHGKIYNLEQKIHKKFENHKPVNGYGSSELIHNSVFLEVLEYLKGSGLPMSISNSFYLRVIQEIKMYVISDDILSFMDDDSELSDKDIVKEMKLYFENKIWNRIFSCEAKMESIKGKSVDIKTKLVQRNKQTGEIVEVNKGE